jgi:dihydroorotate dehydrogenase electron transfer subunit
MGVDDLGADDLDADGTVADAAAADCAHPGACASADLARAGRVTANAEVAPGCFRLEIECPETARATRPGQFVMLRAREGMDPFLSRAFSVSDLVHGEGPAAPPTGIAVLLLVVGVGTRALSERRPGETIGVLGPLGKPYDLGDPREHMVLLAGGIGAAPFALVGRALRERSREQRVTYLVGGRDRGHVYLADEMSALGCEVAVATDDGSLGRRGYVTDLLAPLLADGVRVLACGPNPMFQALAKVVAGVRARGLRVPCQVSTEETMPCGFGACAGCVVPVHAPPGPAAPAGWKWVKSCVEGPVFPVEAIRWDLIRSTH